MKNRDVEIGAAVMVKKSVETALVGETGVIIDMLDEGNVLVQFFNPNLGEFYDRISTNNREPCRGFSLDRLILIDNQYEIFCSEEEIMSIIGGIQ